MHHQYHILALRRISSLHTAIEPTSLTNNVHESATHTRTVRHHEAASTGVASAASPGVSDCFSPGATTAATASFRRLAVATTSNTSAIPARHPARRLTNSAHSCGPNTRAVARLTRSVCAGCASLPVSRPTRIAVDSQRNQENQSGVNKFVRLQGVAKDNGKEKRTVDDPTFDFGWGHLQYGGYVCVRQILPDVLEAEICKG